VGGFFHVMTKPLDVRSTVLQVVFKEYIQSWMKLGFHQDGDFKEMCLKNRIGQKSFEKSP
jgi:hypothetical protein